MTALPPVVAPSNVSVVGVAFREWTGHWDACPACHRADWYDPGAPTLVPPEEVTMEDHEIKVGPRQTKTVRVRVWRGREDVRRLDSPGAPAYYIDDADPRVLCGEGRRLFRRWIRAIVKGIVDVHADDNDANDDRIRGRGDAGHARADAPPRERGAHRPARH